jgi:hypothetical protein
VTDYLVFDTKPKAQAAADDLWAKYGPTVHETDLKGNPTGKSQVTVRWDVPRQRKDASWIIQDHATVKVDPVNAPKATETYSKTWFDSAIKESTGTPAGQAKG